ncbi:hypothetical protein XYCOK13_14390 [Xylanibacillus composti]|uniref:DUF2802 domain-containing protein n=1 Tax=Xylanibacillus composti TaxID=1572762 RepID=A0A8J4M203_9BACL|nr:hypothetical protein [Xylanibacillus composti]GIQ68615.1 hypothetical protein XYCOK13_14390 [Xylanibacillus composti]
MEAWHYIVVLGLLCIVYAALLPRRSNAEQTQEISRQLEGSLDAFAAELEDSNSKLVEAMTEIKRTQDARMNELRERLALQEQRTIETERELRKAEERLAEVERRFLSISTAPTLPAASADETKTGAAFSASPAAKEGHSPMRTRYAELFALYESGKSIEAIAKKLGMNKGEVQLIVTLAGQEEQAGVQK